jgi:hypothetical protein
VIVIRLVHRREHQDSADQCARGRYGIERRHAAAVEYGEDSATDKPARDTSHGRPSPAAGEAPHRQALHNDSEQSPDHNPADNAHRRACLSYCHMARGGLSYRGDPPQMVLSPHFDRGAATTPLGRRAVVMRIRAWSLAATRGTDRHVVA